MHLIEQSFKDARFNNKTFSGQEDSTEQQAKDLG